MASTRTISEMRLVNGSTGDPALFVDYPGKNNAFLFDAGEICSLDAKRLGDLEAVFITHHHLDHFVGFDRILRANLDCDKILHVFGPEGTIRKVYQRITSYEYRYFPSMKIVLRAHEILADRLRTADLDCQKQFPEPTIEETTWLGPVVYENADLAVEAVHVDHTAPCLAFALVEKPGIHPDPDKLAKGGLRPGPWVEQTLKMLRAGQAESTEVDIDGGRFTLGQLRAHYFAVSEGTRIAYVTDTLWSPKVKKGLIQLAKRAQRLYCDAYYALTEKRQADTHRHMTATHAARLARLAKVEELILMHFAPRYQGRYQELVEEARQIFPRVSAESVSLIPDRRF